MSRCAARASSRLLRRLPFWTLGGVDAKEPPVAYVLPVHSASMWAPASPSSACRLDRGQLTRVHAAGLTSHAVAGSVCSRPEKALYLDFPGAAPTGFDPGGSK
jgi:hypothetical protein